MCGFAYTSYEKVLYELRKYLRGQEFNYTLFRSKLLVLDQVAIDMRPIIEYESSCTSQFQNRPFPPPPRQSVGI